MTTAATTSRVDSGVHRLLAETSTVGVRPRYEGNNICTWIGFKHVNYLVEEAVLEHFRNAGLASRLLFEEYGLGVDVVALDTRILHAFHLDEPGTATVEPTTGDADEELSFLVTIHRDGSVNRDVLSKVRVALRRDDYLGGPVEAPAGLERFTAARIGSARPGATVGAGETTVLSDGRGTTGDPVLDQLTAGRNAFGWKWRIPYPYCHNNERLQMSGYLRQMEEVVDLFLADRGISIKTMLDQRRWIPVVPHSRIELLDEVVMEEELYTIYTVEEVFKNLTYRSRMDTYVVRDGQLVPTATGTITHAYAQIDSRKDWHLVEFDEPVLRALGGERVSVGRG